MIFFFFFYSTWGTKSVLIEWWNWLKLRLTSQSFFSFEPSCFPLSHVTEGGIDIIFRLSFFIVVLHWFVSDWIHPHLYQFFFEMSVPVVFYLVVRSLMQMGCYGRPPKTPATTSKLNSFLSSIIICLIYNFESLCQCMSKFLNFQFCVNRSWYIQNV